MAERWFSQDELRELSRPTMDRAIEALDRGDVEAARALCEQMRHEWRFMHDLLVDSLAGVFSFVKARQGEDAIEEMHRFTMERGWRRDVEAIARADRRHIVEALAATWRAHSTSGTGPHPGAFEIEEDDEKFTFRMNPCGSGQRLWRMGRYEGEDGWALMEKPRDWTYGREGFPIYCTHCAFMNEILAIEWVGWPVYPSEPPEDFDHDPCVWHWYKDPADIPERHWTRWGLEKPARVDGA
jgi:hypothetical protein